MDYENRPGGILSGREFAQTFTALNSGKVASVQAAVGRRSPTVDSDGLLVKIASLDQAGLPGTVLATATVPTSAVPAGNMFEFTLVTANFGNPAPVVAGQRYALILDTPTSAPNIAVYGWRCFGSDGYPRGEGLFKNADTVTWQRPISAFDAVFAIFVSQQGGTILGTLARYRLIGISGDDRIIDGPVGDQQPGTIFGGPHREAINTFNNPAARNDILCGPGFERMIADAADLVRGCGVSSYADARSLIDTIAIKWSSLTSREAGYGDLRTTTSNADSGGGPGRSIALAGARGGGPKRVAGRCYGAGPPGG